MVFGYVLAGAVLFLLVACSSSDGEAPNSNPTFTSGTTISVVEGTTATGYTATATDPDSNDTLSFSISGGADEARFGIDAASGVLSFAAAPEFANPADADGDNVYEVELTVADGRSGTDTLTLLVTVTSNNVAPTFTSSDTVSVTEGSTITGYTATATDGNAGDTLTFSVSGGTDEAQFTIDAASGVLSFATAPDFSMPADANGDNDYEVQLTVDDGRSGTDTLDLVVTVVAQSDFSLEVTFPTANANLGGGVTQTTVTGNVVDTTGAAIELTDISYVAVNGEMALLDLTDPGRWSVQVPVTEGSNTLAVELALTSGTVINSTQELHNFGVYISFGRMELDAANNRLLIIDGFIDGLIGVDLTTDERSVISGGGIGAGTTFSSPRDSALDTPNNRALVVDWQRDALYAVDFATGDRTELSGPGTGAGVVLDGPNAVALDSAGNRAIIIASINNELISVDLASGDRTVLSAVGTGSGPDFNFPEDLVVDTVNDRLLVSDDGLSAIFAVDLATGDRSILSDATTGTGVDLGSPAALSLDAANNRVLVADRGGVLIGVDLTTGNRTEIAETVTTYGINGTRLAGLVTDSASNRALLSDPDVDAIFSVDLASGDLTIFSSSAVGAGGPETLLQSIRGMAHDVTNQRLLLPRSANQSLISANLASGDRSIVSGGGNGTGPELNGPQRLVVDAENNRAVVVSSSGNALIGVDLDSGDRTILSDNASVGSGPLFSTPQDVFVDAASDRAFVLDAALGLFSVDLATGNRSIVSDAATGSGPLWGFADSLDADLATDTGYVTDDGDTALYSVNLTSGDRAVISNNAGIGTGPSISFPNDVRIDTANNRAFIVNRGTFSNLMAIDLASGDRTIVSGSGVGSGQPLWVPYYVDIDPGNNRAFVYDLPTTGIILVELSGGERVLMSK